MYVAMWVCAFVYNLYVCMHACMKVRTHGRVYACVCMHVFHAKTWHAILWNVMCCIVLYGTAMYCNSEYASRLRLENFSGFTTQTHVGFGTKLYFEIM